MRLLPVVFVLSSIIAGAQALPDETVTVNITVPERFHVGNLIFEPGVYTFEHTAGAVTLQMQAAQGETIQLPVRTIATAPLRESRATLIKTGGTYYLDKLWVADKPYGFDIAAAMKPAQVAEYQNDSPGVLKTRPTTSESPKAEQPVEPPRTENRTEREIHRELVLLPSLSIFDDVGYTLDGQAVTLTGLVTKPALKEDAERAVKNIEGINQVVNNIQILPSSPADDRIRFAEYRAIYGSPALGKYGTGVLAPIHIIVSSGKVTLTGLVDSAADKDQAAVQANGVPGVSAVENNLGVRKP